MAESKTEVIQLNPKPVDLEKIPTELKDWPSRDYVKLKLVNNTRIGKAVSIYIRHRKGMKSDYSDLRLYDSNHGMLPYWISKYDKYKAVCFVRLTGQAISDNYIYYAWGKKGAVFKGSHASSTFRLRVDRKTKEVLDKQLYKPQPTDSIKLAVEVK